MECPHRENKGNGLPSPLSGVIKQGISWTYKRNLLISGLTLNSETSCVNGGKQYRGVENKHRDVF